MEELRVQLLALAREVRGAARPLARAPAEARTRAILGMAAALHAASAELQEANAADVAEAKERGLSAAMCDRLTLTPERIADLEASVREIAAQPDPIGVASRTWSRPNGLQVAKVRIPNVTMDAAALCVRSGNAVILRGGSEAARSNAVLCRAAQAALNDAGLPRAAVTLVPTQARLAIDTLLTFDELIDLCIPRGGEQLIRRVCQQSRIPVVKHYKGVCHVYVDARADVEMAQRIAENAKVQRPGVCNAMETLLVHAHVAPTFVPKCVRRLQSLGVQVRGCEATQKLVPGVVAATETDWDTEFLDLVVAVRVVASLDEAIAHIDAHGTQHTASIVTEDSTAALRFTREVDCSCVLVNASTRFNDGGQLGLGAEMGISTTRVHAYGPMGAEALTAEKFVVSGSGQVRG
jgi:glutamate-5-semialdehyde dehydrogenase